MTAYAPAAHSKSAIAPLTSSCALAGVSSSLAGMLLGVSTWRALLKRSHPTAASSARASVAAYLIGPPPSIAQVDGQHPLCELRQRRLLPRAEVAAPAPAEEHGFRLDAAVAGPGVQVPPGHGHRRPIGADGVGPGVGQRVRH